MIKRFALNSAAQFFSDISEPERAQKYRLLPELPFSLIEIIL
jgi:hypothetical protein